MGGFIILRVNAGLCDAMYMLEMITPYAVEHKRTIVWDLVLYPASDLTSIFDFSNYPVKVLCGKDKYKKIGEFYRIEPRCYGRDMFKIAAATAPGLYTIDGKIAHFDMSCSYSSKTLLIYHGGHGGWLTMENFRFTTKLLDTFKLKKAQLPDSYSAIHLRATDHFDQNLEKSLAEIDEFVKDKTAVYLATDNMSLMDSLSSKYSQIIKAYSYQQILIPYVSLHTKFGQTDPHAVEKAVIDILICASSKKFLASAGGFSRIIWHLNNTPDLLKRVLNE